MRLARLTNAGVAGHTPRDYAGGSVFSVQPLETRCYITQVMTSPIIAAKIAAVVTHPSTFILRLLTRLP
jgi:hypothetical protein